MRREGIRHASSKAEARRVIAGESGQVPDGDSANTAERCAFSGAVWREQLIVAGKVAYRCG